MKTDSRNDIYRKRVYRVQDYIASNYHRKISLDKLASIAAFSPFHFHRIFRAITNETLQKYINRIRLEKSCFFLNHMPSLRIIDIALACGFETPSSFAKAFRKRYSITPFEYRHGEKLHIDETGTENSKTGTEESRDCKENIFKYPYDTLKFTYTRRKSMIVKIEEMRPYRLAYMRRIGPYGDGNYELMDSIKKWAFAHDLFSEDCIILGIAHDDPAVTLQDKCRYDCGIVIGQDFKLDDEMNEYQMPGGKYAVCEINHTAQDIAKAWEELFSVWLPASGYLLDEKPVFERYKKLNEKELGAEICIPVKPV